MSSFKKQLESQNRDKYSKNVKNKLTSLNNKENLLCWPKAEKWGRQSWRESEIIGIYKKNEKKMLKIQTSYSRHYKKEKSGVSILNSTTNLTFGN